MKSGWWFCSLRIFIVLCACLVNVVTSNATTANASIISYEPVDSATPAPGGTEPPHTTSVGPADEAVTTIFSSIDANVSISTNSSTSVDSNVSTTIGYNMSTSVDSNVSTTIGTNVSTSVDSNVSTTTGYNISTSVDGNVSTTIGTNISTSVDSNVSTTIGYNISTSVDSNVSTTVVTNVSMETAEDSDTVDSRANPTMNVSEVFPTATVDAVAPPEGCLCDLTPGFCDIGCCCDTVDCNVANLSTVFTGCPQKVVLGVCIEKWLMFRANVNSSLVTETDSLFCVRSEDQAPQSLPSVLQYPVLGTSYHFSPPISKNSNSERAFYKVDDAIQTYFSSSFVRGVLRQPSPGVAAAFCINRNPARFLRSESLSCARVLTLQSCTTDPNLNAFSYFHDLHLIKIPIAETASVSGLLIPVTPVSSWSAPSQQSNSCINVVKKVEFVIGYTNRGELVYATVNIVLADVDPNEFLLQTHSVQFQLASPSPTPREPVPAVGFTMGSPVIVSNNGNPVILTTLGVSQHGQCSSDPSRRAPVRFTHNTITGCAFSSTSKNCSELRSQIYEIFQGPSVPDAIAMNSGFLRNWTQVINQACPTNLQETCDTGCILPSSLSIQVLWARQGLLDFPQNYILGAKYLFHCQKVTCPVSSPLTLTTQVTFADTTVYPQAPRGSPQANWKFPFGFFSRGTVELDGHIIFNSSEKINTWSIMLFTVIFITRLLIFFIS